MKNNIRVNFRLDKTENDVIETNRVFELGATVRLSLESNIGIQLSNFDRLEVGDSLETLERVIDAKFRNNIVLFDFESLSFNDFLNKKGVFYVRLSNSIGGAIFTNCFKGFYTEIIEDYNLFNLINKDYNYYITFTKLKEDISYIGGDVETTIDRLDNLALTNDLVVSRYDKVNGVFTRVEYKDPITSDTIIKSVLSNLNNDKYLTRTETYFDYSVEPTLELARVFSLTYDSDGELISEVLNI